MKNNDGAGELEGALGQDAVSAEHESPERHGAADAPPERLANGRGSSSAAVK